MRLRLSLALAALLSLQAACAAAPTASLDAVKALIGDAACDDDTQCRTVAIGAKACGGPEAWVAWSTKRTDAAALQSAAAGYNRQRAEEVARSGRASDCMLVADPGARCRAEGGVRACRVLTRATRLER
jgi:hypothetical protein